LIANEANTGDIKIRATIPINVPTNENKMPTPKALSACPLSASGLPSKQVATEEGVPGILSKIAEIKPPDIPPIYKPIIVPMPSVVVRL